MVLHRHDMVIRKSGEWLHSAGEHRPEVAKFLFQVHGGVHGLRHLFPQQVPIPPPQPMHRHLDRAFAHPQSGPRFRTSQVGPIAGQEHPEPLEEPPFIPSSAHSSSNRWYVVWIRFVAHARSNSLSGVR